MGNFSGKSTQDVTNETANERYQPTAKEARKDNKDDTLKDRVERSVDTNPEGGNRQKGIRDNNNS